MGTIRVKKQVAPSTPVAGYVELYVDVSDGVFKVKDETGNVTNAQSGVNGIDTKANLDALPREEGKIYYATDTNFLYLDDGVTLNPVDNTGVDGIDTTVNLNALTRSVGKIYYDTTLQAMVYDDGIVLAPINSDIDTTGVDGIDTTVNLNALPRSAGKIYYDTTQSKIVFDNGASLAPIDNDNTGVDASDTTANLFALPRSAGKLYYSTDEMILLLDDGTTLQDTGSGSGGGLIERTQVAHGFSVGNAIYHDGVGYSLAQADNELTLAQFVVSEVLDVDNFKAVKFGQVTSVGHGFTTGSNYFLSDAVAGSPVLTESNQFSCPLFYVEDANTLIVQVYRPAGVAAAGGGSSQLVAYIEDVKPSGTIGGATTSGSYLTRDLNTIRGDLTFASLVSNEFTLIAGQYILEASAPAFVATQHKIRLYNVTNLAVEQVGDLSYSHPISPSLTRSTVKCTIDIAVDTTYRIEHQVTSANALGFGVPAGFGDDEIYTTVKVIKL